ncbi:unnamed protein product [Acanthoscelides obtectus]|uniref:Uncharacterized protein n=1 Tax=Acanthoscelides obtectus TaxID=200917 RepID=A0A9P0NYU4_ACAOB|nr:unnamed protein product [Acanthoscelides obtectus]CAK1633870.1 hypothetical protein AOBTE_LOCUS8451 [Acanthoscelides obtectus]
MLELISQKWNIAGLEGSRILFERLLPILTWIIASLKGIPLKLRRELRKVKLFSAIECRGDKRDACT